MTENISNNNFKNWLHNNRRKIIFFLILTIIIAFCCLLTCKNIKAFSQKKFHWTEEQKGTFVKIGKTYTGPYVRKIIPIENNKYLLFSDSACEIFDGNTYKFTLLFPNFEKYNIKLIYNIEKISEEEIEIIGFNQTENNYHKDIIKSPRYRIMLNTKTFEITELPVYSYPDIEGYPDLINDIVSKTKVKISNKRDFYIGGYSAKAKLMNQNFELKTRIVDYDKKQIIEGPALNAPRKDASALLLDDDNVLVVGGYGLLGEYLSPSEIEICNINQKKCKIIGKVHFPGPDDGSTSALLNNLDGKLLYVPIFRLDEYSNFQPEIQIQTINPKTGEAKSEASFFPINEKLPVKGMSLVQLKNGDLLFVGGVSGVGLGYKNENVHKIFDIKTRGIRDTKSPLNYPRHSLATTMVLEDGNVLIVGGSKMAEVYISE